MSGRHRTSSPCGRSSPCEPPRRRYLVSYESQVCRPHPPSPAKPLEPRTVTARTRATLALVAKMREDGLIVEPSAASEAKTQPQYIAKPTPTAVTVFGHQLNVTPQAIAMAPRRSSVAPLHGARGSRGSVAPLKTVEVLPPILDSEKQLLEVFKERTQRYLEAVMQAKLMARKVRDATDIVGFAIKRTHVVANPEVADDAESFEGGEAGGGADCGISTGLLQWRCSCGCQIQSTLAKCCPSPW